MNVRIYYESQKTSEIKGTVWFKAGLGRMNDQFGESVT